VNEKGKMEGIQRRSPSNIEESQHTMTEI